MSLKYFKSSIDALRSKVEHYSAESHLSNPSGQFGLSMASNFYASNSADFSILDELRDFEINPKAPQELTQQLIQEQVAGFLNINKHPDRVLPVWRKSLNIHTVGLLTDSEKYESYSNALNKLSLVANIGVRHVAASHPELNVMVLFIDGREQLGESKPHRSALQALGLKPETIKKRISDHLVYDKQSTEYRLLRFSQDGAKLFLYIVDVGWVNRLDKSPQQKLDIFDSQLRNVAYRVFTLQDGVVDCIKYSQMNHKYFWKRIRDYAPIDKAFIRALYSKKMKKPRSKRQAAKCISYCRFMRALKCRMIVCFHKKRV